MGSGNDVRTVLFGTVNATILSQSTTQLVVVAPAAAAAGPVAITIETQTMGRGVSTITYLYNPGTICLMSCLQNESLTPQLTAGVITSFDPAGAPITGARNITILGTNLGNGSDITAVTVANVPVLRILSQNTTFVVVEVAPIDLVALNVTGPVNGSIVVRSTSFGTTTTAAAQSFSYFPRT